MNNLKFTFLNLVIVAALVGGGYFAFQNLESGEEYVVSDDAGILADEYVPVDTSAALSDAFESELERADIELLPETPSTELSPEDQGLVDALQKLVDDVVVMKNGSRGTRVGTLQEFLNRYEGKDSRVDNDYGPGTESRIRAFQKAEGLTADGQAGPTTYKKMIEWLKNQ